jgi:ADP-ribosyltransferase exoenzyme
MSGRGYCRAKNPSACRSPRCPGRGGGSSQTAIPATMSGSPAASVPDQPSERPEDRQRVAMVSAPREHQPVPHDQASHNHPGPFGDRESQGFNPFQQKISEILSDIEQRAPKGQAEILAEQQELSEEMFERLSEPQKKAIIDYTNQAYTRLNDTLREGGQISPDDENLRDLIDSVFVDANRSYDEPQKLYRSMSPTNEVDGEDTLAWAQRRFAPGSIVNFKSYSSTSASLHSTVRMLRKQLPEPVSERFMTRAQWEEMAQEEVSQNLVMEMVTREGVSVSKLSHMPQEAEVLLPRGQYYLVDKVDQVTYTSDQNILTGEQERESSYPTTRVRLIDMGLFDD